MKTLLETLKRKWSEYLIEVFVITFGILLAFGLNNWNEGRKERIQEREVLEDIMSNLERNNKLIRQSLEAVSNMDASADIVLSAIRDKKPYTETLDAHFQEATRSGALLFPLSTEGYASLKNVGFDIIRSRSLKNSIVEIFEVSYKRIKEKGEFAIDKVIESQNLVSTLFVQKTPGQLEPVDYALLLNQGQYLSFVVDVKSLRAFYIEDVLACLSQSEKVIQVIKDELESK